MRVTIAALVPLVLLAGPLFAGGGEEQTASDTASGVQMTSAGGGYLGVCRIGRTEEAKECWSRSPE